MGNMIPTFSSFEFLNPISPAVTYNDIKQVTEKDSVLKTVVTYMQRGWTRKIFCETLHTEWTYS